MNADERRSQLRHPRYSVLVPFVLLCGIFAAMKTGPLLALALSLFLISIARAQQIVRMTEPNATNPAEVSIAINPKNPDNMIAASLQTGRPPKPRAGSYHYVTFDGGKTWRTVPTPNPTNL